MSYTATITNTTIWFRSKNLQIYQLVTSITFYSFEDYSLVAIHCSWLPGLLLTKDKHRGINIFPTDS